VKNPETQSSVYHQFFKKEKKKRKHKERKKEINPKVSFRKIETLQA